MISYHQVWISLVIAVISITLALWLLTRLHNILNKDITEPEEEFNDLSKTWSYVQSLLLSQGKLLRRERCFCTPNGLVKLFRRQCTIEETVRSACSWNLVLGVLRSGQCIQ